MKTPRSLTLSATVHAQLVEQGVTYRYDIPEMWVIGYTHNGRTIHEAVMWWHRQAQLEAGRRT